MTTTKKMERIFPINEELYPFESNWMEIDGINVHYIDEGQGDAIVFFHGNPTWSVLYAPIIKRLRGSFRCIAIDCPGFGFSETPNEGDYSFFPEDHAKVCGQVIDKLGLEKFSVFVQDWGGPIGLDVATERADRIEKVYIGNTWAWAADLSTEAGQASKAFSEKMGGERERILNKNFFVKMSMKQLTMGYKANAPELVDAIKDAYEKVHPTPESRMGMAVFPTRIMASTPWFEALEKKLPSLYDKPAILFWGEKDPLFSEVQLKDWEDRLTNCKTIRLPEAGHFFQQDSPNEIADAIKAH